MTITEKRRFISRQIDRMDEKKLDLLISMFDDFSSEALKKNQERDELFEKALQETLLRYEKVWKALA